MENPPPPASPPSNDEAVGKSGEDQTVSHKDDLFSGIADQLTQDITKDVDKLPPEGVQILRQAQAQPDVGSLPIIGFSIHLPGRSEPITVKSTDVVALGRKDRISNVAPAIDLSGDHAALLGVSRKHAEIIIRDNQCFIRDLDSANGSWLNEKQLKPNEEMPVRNGDQIRLGHMICFIYFIYARSTSELAQLDEHITTVQLIDSDLKTRQLRTGLTSHYLITVLGNFLDAVIGLQILLNEIRRIERPFPGIKSFDVDHKRKQIDVELKNVRDVIVYLDQKRDVWQSSIVDETQINVTTLQLANALWKSLDKTPDTQRDYYIAQLRAHFKTLLLNNLKLIAYQSDESEPTSDSPPTDQTTHL